MTARAAAALVVAALLAFALAAPAGAARPFATGLTDVDAFARPDAPVAFARARDAGARYVRIGLFWASVVRGGKTRPAELRARDPADPRYDWTRYDRQVREAVAHGLRPVLAISAAPDWADGDADQERPSAPELGDFAFAAATRYSGAFAGLPRVRHWHVWNEPNLDFYLRPQRVRGRAVSPALYRALLNAMSASVKAVHADNVVIAGGLAPFGRHAQTGAAAVSPLPFMRALLCIGPGRRQKRGCPRASRFDVWATNPYTNGGPNHHANAPGDVSLGDLPEMRALLRRAVAQRRIRSRGRLGFWASEFAWDTGPHDPGGVPEARHARWMAEAFYRMWSAGITVVNWFQLRDQAPGSAGFPHTFQSGLYSRGADQHRDTPKLALRAFGFPFVALRRGGRVRVWGRTPHGARGTVAIQRRRGGAWRTVARVRADGSGVFTRRLRLRRTRREAMRAVAAGGTSLPFATAPTRDRPARTFG